MSKKEGFTLIELLAVIVILAVIALIATPIILGVIDNAKKDTAKNSVYGVIDALELTIARNMLKNNTIISGQYELNNKVLTIDDKEYTVSYNGKEGINGTVVIEEQRIVSACLKIDKYSVYYDGENANIEECEGKQTLKEKVSYLPNKKVNINGKVVNKVYGDKSARTTMKNYVWYSGQLWQIIEVNDDTIKLVTSMPVTSIAYGETSDWNSSWVRKWLHEEFLKILTRKDLIVPTSYCLDSPTTSTEDVVQDETYTIKKVLSHTKINECQNQIIDNAGLLTFEDYVYALNGETPNYTEANFISGDELEWTMSAYDNDQMWITWYNSSREYITVTQTSFSFVKGYGHGVRPVISIKANSLVNKGDGSNTNPYILTSEQIVTSGENIYKVKVGDYVYIDESNNPNTYTTDRLTRDVTYPGTKDKVRYRVVKVNSDKTVKVQRADILRNLPSTVAIKSNIYVPYYYKDSATESERCMYDETGKYGTADKWYTEGCRNNNIFNPTQGNGAYAYQDSENIGYFLNNTNNGYYSWLSDTTKNMIVNATWQLYTGGYGKDYSNLNNSSVTTYPERTNDGETTAKIGLPTWGEMYSGNDINYSYWLINRWSGSSSNVSYVNYNGNAHGSYAALSWFGVRPVFHLKSNIKIISGEGTPTNPYTLTMG